MEISKFVKLLENYNTSLINKLYSDHDIKIFIDNLITKKEQLSSNVNGVIYYIDYDDMFISIANENTNSDLSAWIPNRYDFKSYQVTGIKNIEHLKSLFYNIFLYQIRTCKSLFKDGFLYIMTSNTSKLKSLIKNDFNTLKYIVDRYILYYFFKEFILKSFGKEDINENYEIIGINITIQFVKGTPSKYILKSNEDTCINQDFIHDNLALDFTTLLFNKL